MEILISILETTINIIFSTWMAWLVWLIILFIVLLFVRRIIHDKAIQGSYYDHATFLVRLPKEKPGDQEKEFTVQMLREEIAAGEAIFAAIGGLRAERGFKAWLYGRRDHFSFEIVAHNKTIAFYVVAPRSAGRYLEQQVLAHYPEAVVEEVEDYNIFKPEFSTIAGYMKTTRKYLFPLKTYQKLETDGMNSLINVMSKLENQEGLAIQYITRSANASWHQAAKGVGRRVMQGKGIQEAIKLSSPNPFLSLWYEFVSSSKPKKANDPYSASQARLSAMEEEMLKGIEEKNSKAGLDVNIRIVVSAANKGRAHDYLSNLASAYSQFNYYEYGNSFLNKVRIGNQKKLLNDFIYRRFDQKIKMILNTAEMASLFHFPLRITETPNILWLSAKQAAAPTDLPESGLLLGHNIYRGQKQEIYFKREDRRRHTYIVGKSGVGKSVLQAGMAIQDIINGEGVCVVDPHGDLINDILRRVPQSRADDVVLFAPADIERPLALNLLEYDPRYPEQKTFVINEMIKIFDKLYDLKSTGGPIFEQYIRNAMLLIMAHPESGSTLMEVPKVLADAEFRKMKLNKCPDPTVVDFWKKEAEKAGGDAALANVVPYVTSKLTQFISNDTMRPIIGQQISSFNFRDIMDQQKILLVDLSKGQVGEMNAYLLGMILVGKILMSALSRTDMPQEQRKDFYLYIDEFQNFTTDSISSILSEARKYNLNLIIAHQYLGQLVKAQDTSIRDAVFGNVGTWISFKVGSEDAKELAKEFSPVFNEFDLINVEKYTAYVKLLVDNTASRAFSMKTIWPLPGEENPTMAEKIRQQCRLKYGQDRNLIEAEIQKRARLN